MSWAARRRLIVLIIVGAVIVAFLAIVSIATFYKEPSCSDGVRNQEEVGVDCGGPCAYLCREQVQSPTVLFTKTVASGTNRVDVVASVENVNATAAAGAVPYTISIYGDDGASVREITGTLDLPPLTKVPVFIPGVSSNTQRPLRAFLTIEPTNLRWFAVRGDTRVKPVVINTRLSISASSPRVDATLANFSTKELRDVRVIAFIHDTAGDIIAASQTVVPIIHAQGQATATFTWNNAFVSAPAAIEILPVIPLL